MRVLRNNTWTRRGCSLLWDATVLSNVAQPSEVVSLREFIALSRDWPEDLPSGGGDALVVAGVEGCLDALSPEDAARWVHEDLRQRIFDFQDAYQGEAALVFWLPSGHKRRHYDLATEEYSWAGLAGARLDVGRLLWAGARADVHRIVPEAKADPDGNGWVGLYHPRIS